MIIIHRKSAKFYNFCPIACGQKEWYLKADEEMPDDKEHPVSMLSLF